MASTYENDLRLEEMATGENSGSWGTKTNTNLELIADAFSYGTETIANADTTITIADGAADAARSLALKINSSEDLTTTRVVTLAPNTTSKVWIIENNTSGGQTLTISAGSGSNITLLNGQTKIIATDGIGAGSNVVELTQDLAIADLFIDDDLSMQSDGAIINFGADADITLTHAADTSLTLGGAGTTTGLIVNNTATDGDPFMSFALSGTQTFTMGIDDGDSDKFKIGTSAIGTNTRLTIDSTGDVEINQGNFTVTSIGTGAAAGPYFNLSRNSSSPADDDAIGIIQFNGKNDQDESLAYVQIQTNILDATDATEDGYFRVNVRANGSLEDSLTISNNNIIFNDSSLDRDFRVESDGNANMLFVDASANLIGVGTNAPSHPSGSGITIYDASVPRIAFKNSTTGNTSTDGGEILMSGNQMYVQNRENESLFLTTNATTRVTVGTAETAINDGSYNYDFRVESDGNANMLFVDGGSNSVAIGTSAPSSYVNTGGLAVKGSTYSDLALISSSIASGNNSHQIRYYNDAGAIYEIARTRVNVGAGQVNRGEYQFAVNNGAGLRQWLDVNYQGDVVFNDGSHDSDFRVESNNATHMLYVDSTYDRIGINTNTPAHMLNLAGTGDVGIHIQADTDNSGENDNPYLSMGQDGSSSQQFKLGMVGEAGQEFTGSVANASFIHANNNSDQPLQLAHFGQEVATLYNTTAIFNELGANQDFRVESNANTHAIYLDAGAYSGAGAIGFGVSSPEQHVHQANDTGRRLGGITEWSGNLADIANGATRTITLTGLGNYSSAMVELWVAWRLNGGNEPATSRILITFYEGNNSITDITVLEFSGKNIVQSDWTTTTGSDFITFEITNTSWSGTSTFVAGAYYVKGFQSPAGATLTVG